MTKKIEVIIGTVKVEVELNESETAKRIYEALPFSAKAQTWGDEIYFTIPVDMTSENEKEVVELGEVGYWPPGKAMCLFFGPTPSSRGDEIRPASAVNPIGKIQGDPKVLKKVKEGEDILVKALE